VFASRCLHATDVCRRQRPASRTVGGRSVACHRAEELEPVLPGVAST
jgi:hypothetical protein